MIVLNSFTLLPMDRLQLTAVYCNRRGVAQNGYRKSDDELIQPDNKLRIGTKSGKSRIGHECVVTMHDADTNDNMFTIVLHCVVTLHDAYTNDNITTSTDFHSD